MVTPHTKPRLFEPESLETYRSLVSRMDMDFIAGLFGSSVMSCTGNAQEQLLRESACLPMHRKLHVSYPCGRYLLSDASVFGDELVRGGDYERSDLGIYARDYWLW